MTRSATPSGNLITLRTAANVSLGSCRSWCSQVLLRSWPIFPHLQGYPRMEVVIRISHST